MTKQLSPIVIRVVEKNAEVLEEFGIAALHQDVRDTASKALGAIVASVQAQGDTNPADADQVREIWLNFINQDASALLSSEVNQLIDKVGSPEVQALLKLLVPSVLATLKEVTDGNKEDNKEDIELIWKSLIKDPEFLTRIFGLIRILF